MSDRVPPVDLDMVVPSGAKSPNVLGGVIADGLNIVLKIS
jgi:hypothetical protein